MRPVIIVIDSPHLEERELHAVRVGPGIGHLSRQFTPTVHRNHLRGARSFCYTLEGRQRSRPDERKIRFDSLTAATS